MEQKQHVCPVWVGKLMASPLRKLFHNPNKILKAHVRPGMKVLELGPALGFFSLPIARIVGDGGKVYCVDIQSEMLQKLEVRAMRAQLLDKIETRVSCVDTFNIDDLTEQLDFALLFAVVHEVPSQKLLFSEVSNTLKKESLILFAEPKGHVSAESFKESIDIAASFGLSVLDNIKVRGSRAVLMKKN